MLANTCRELPVDMTAAMFTSMSCPLSQMHTRFKYSSGTSLKSGAVLDWSHNLVQIGATTIDFYYFRKNPQQLSAEKSILSAELS